MIRQRIQKAYEGISPNEEAKERMLHKILSNASETRPAGKDDTMKQKRMRPAVCVALIALAAAMTVTVFASEEIAGWFKQYFIRNAERGLTAEQIEYLDENEQMIDENQKNNGYNLKLKSVLADRSTVYVTLGITAPSDVKMEESLNMWGSDIDFYDENRMPCASWTMDAYDDMDGLDNTIDLMFQMNPGDWNSSNLWTLRIDRLGRLFYDEAYEKELLETKYADQENFMFTDEEAAQIYQQTTIADGPWEFSFDLSKVEKEVIEFVTEPVTVEIRSGIQEDGTYLYEVVQITSAVISPLSVTIQTDSDYPPDFTSGDRRIYAVMDDGTRIALLSNWGVGGKQHFSAESPIVPENVDYLLLADGTKLKAP